ncbi:MAG: amidase [Candidatus Aminicenantes bacterium]|nr:amidase [Candidatus Aminicenantes bacterium]
MKRKLLNIALLIIMSMPAANACRCGCKDGIPAADPAGTSINLEEITVRQLQQGYQEGRFTIVQVVQSYLQRIEAIDRSGPRLNSIICLNPDALAAAAELDREIQAGKIRGPLHGIPVILKDNIDSRDTMPTTAGATVLRNSYIRNDSWVAKKLRAAGAVILAKANLSEWANFRANISSSGWSGVGGQTHNPYVLDRNPCGSSSGSGVAVSANLCAIAIGTETNGSIVCPANNNGIVGLKPTVGLISRSGIIPISSSQDTAGPMGRSVEDVAICLGALTGIDEADGKTPASLGNYQTDYTPFLKADGLKGKRIGLLKNSAAYHFKVDVLLRQAAAELKSLGAEVIEIEPLPERDMENDSFQVMLYEFKDGLNRYFAGLDAAAQVKDLAGLIEFNKADPIELRYFDQALLEQAQAKGGLETPEYKKALAAMFKAAREDGIDKLLAANKLDALMAPTGAPAWKTDLVDGDHFIGGSSSLAAIAGYPSITVPMGFIDQLPVGVSFTGRAWSEPLLLEIAYAYEQGTKHRRPPKFLVSD